MGIEAWRSKHFYISDKYQLRFLFNQGKNQPSRDKLLHYYSDQTCWPKPPRPRILRCIAFCKLAISFYILIIKMLTNGAIFFFQHWILLIINKRISSTCWCLLSFPTSFISTLHMLIPFHSFLSCNLFAFFLSRLHVV